MSTLIRPDGTPLGNQDERVGGDESPLLVQVVNMPDGGKSVRLVHEDTGTYMAFMSDGTVEVKDSYGSTIKTTPNGDMIVAGPRYSIVTGNDVLFRHISGKKIHRVFSDGKDNSAEA